MGRVVGKDEMTGPTDESARDRSVRRVLKNILALNLLVAGAKLIVGWLSSSISMVADGFHSLTDSASNVVGLVGISVARQPADEDHPYGHRKFETLAVLVIGGLLAMTAWEILESCIDRLRAGGTPRVGVASFVVMATTILINLGVALFEARKAKTLGSEILRADAAHTRADIFTSLSVVASLVAARLGYPQLDMVAALLITVVIAVAAFKVLRRSSLVLADTAAVPEERVREIVLRVPGVVSVHKIRTRGLPETGYADLHVQVRPELRLDQAHVIGHMVTEELRAELGFVDILVHVEPPVGHRTEWRPEASEDVV
jgi:cation diffusion facilitator family transporter